MINNKWTGYHLSLDHQILTSQHLEEALSKFWSEVISNKVLDNQFILIQFKVILSEILFRSISLIHTIKNF